MNYSRIFLVVMIGLLSSPPLLECRQAGDQKGREEPTLQPVRQEAFRYVLGPDDVITVKVLDAEEIGKDPVRIDPNGYISLPMLGRIHVAGFTVEQFEFELASRMKTYLVQPVVAVSVVEYRSQPVSVLGAVTSPGIKQLEGRKTLVEILSMAGGLRTDAGYTLKITRRAEWGAIPLPSAKTDPSGNFSVAEVKLKDIMDASKPEENILIKPNDIITVPRADIVYVMGDVRKPGGFVLNERGTISALQALAMAEGLERTAVPKNAKIIRPVPNAKQVEIAINLKDILNGKKGDVELEPNDILLVPGSASKSAWQRTADTAISALTSVVIYRGIY